MTETIIKTVKSGKIIHVPWPDSYINVETGNYVSDIRKISGFLDWQPKINLQQGVARTCAYYKKYHSHYR